MGDSKPATYGHFKTSHQFQGFAFPFSLYPPSFPVQSIRNRLGFLFPRGEGLRRHNIPADDRSPGCESHPDRLKPPPRQGPPSRGALWLVLNPRAPRARAIRSTLKTTTVLTVPAKMEVCKEPDHVGLGHLAHGVAGQPLQGEQPGGQCTAPADRPPSGAAPPAWRLPGRGHHGGADPLAPLRVGQAHHRHLPDRRVFPNRLLDLQGGDLYPLADAGPFRANRTPSRTRLPFCAGSGLRELLLFSCHSLFITNHVLSSMT